MFTTFFHVALGGALGASARFGVGLLGAFPYGTLTVNVVGSFLMGLAYIYLADNGLDRWMPFVMIGFLGGFTTFSAFSLDTLRLVESGRIGAAGGYVIASVVLSVLALFAGVALMRGLQA